MNWPSGTGQLPPLLKEKRKKMEYFIITNSFAAPFFSDTDQYYVKGKNPLDALQEAVKKYKHPCGLYAANLYQSADDFHKNKKRLAYYICNLVIEQERLTKNLGGYSILHDRDSGGEFIKINDKKHYITNPKGGKCFLEIGK